MGVLRFDGFADFFRVDHLGTKSEESESFLFLLDERRGRSASDCLLKLELILGMV